MKVITIVDAASALADMVVYNALQVPDPTTVFPDAAWLGGTGENARCGLSVLTVQRGLQTAEPTDWIIGNDTAPLLVLSDDQFKAQYQAAPEGAGVPAAPPAPPVEPVTDITTLVLGSYQSHRIVKAAAIAAIDGQNLTLQLDGAPVYASAPDLFARYTPVPGDYLMLYDDGYVSICPGAAFTAGYSPYTPPADNTGTGS